MELRIEPSRHEVMDHSWPWLEALRRNFRGSLFVYRHRESNNFVLCEWYEKGISCGELYTFKGGPTAMWPEDLPVLSVLSTILVSQHDALAARERERREFEADRDRKREVALDERAKTCKWLRRKGLFEEAHNIETGRTPWTSPSEASEDSLRERVDQFTHMAKG